MNRDFAVSWIQKPPTKKEEKLAWRNTETNSGEILVIAASWFLCKKKIRTATNLPENREKISMNVHINQLWWNSYDSRFLVSAKVKK